MREVVAAVAVLGVVPAAAQDRATTPAESAERFQLDLAPTDEDAAVTAAAEAPPVEAPPATRYSLDTPIAELLTNYRSKAVLDKDMPGLSTDKNLDKFKDKSLNQLAPLSGGRLDAKLLEKVGKDLAKIEPER